MIGFCLTFIAGNGYLHQFFLVQTQSLSDVVKIIRILIRVLVNNIRRKADPKPVIKRLNFLISADNRLLLRKDAVVVPDILKSPYRQSIIDIIPRICKNQINASFMLSEIRSHMG